MSEEVPTTSSHSLVQRFQNSKEEKIFPFCQMTLDEFELQRFLVSHGLRDNVAKVIAVEGLEFSDKYDNLFYIQRVENGYAIHPRGKVKNECVKELRRIQTTI